MNGMRTWTFPECRPPGDGPWQDEPDKAQWVDDATGLDCLIVRVPFHGALCGYVGVPPQHPWHGRDWSEVCGLVDVHDGITYSAPCVEGAEDGPAVCHIPGPGRPHDVWWLGFAAAGAFDHQPAFEHRINASNPGREKAMAATWADAEEWMRPVYRTFDYVRDQVTHLAGQVHAVAVDA
jgi:hypothetical protein